MLEKSQKFYRKIQLRSDDDIFFYFAKMHSSEVSVLNFKSRVLEFLMKSLSRRLPPRLHHCCDVTKELDWAHLRTGVSKNVFALRTGLGLELFCGPTINIITNVWWWKFVTAQKSAPGNEFLTDRRWAATRISSTTNFSIMTVKIDG